MVEINNKGGLTQSIAAAINNAQTTETTTQTNKPTVSTQPPEPRDPFAQFINVAPPLPEPQLTQEEVADRYQDIIKTLTNPDADMGSIMRQIEQLQATFDKMQADATKTQIEGKKTLLDANHKATLEKIDQAAAKLKEQKNLDLAIKIFGAVAMAIAVVAAIATGGALAIGVALVGAALYCLQQSGVTDMAFDAMGVSKDARQWIMLGLNVALLLVGGGAAIANLVKAGTQAAALAATAGATAAKAASSAAVGAQAASYGAKAAQIAQLAASTVKLTGAGLQIGSAIVGYQIAEIDHQKKGIDRQTMVIMQMMQQLIDDLKKLMQQADENVVMTANVVDETHKSMMNQIQPSAV
jgi:hypothetical protein